MPDRNPRYQVFISSTFRDLRKERQAVLDAILELGHFPSGMEVFPAADTTPWGVIESIITEADYYILIVGGLYGSTDENGISYTEREYDLAISLKIPVLAFLHRNPESIPAGMSELDSPAREKLAAFRKKVEAHHCKYWTSDGELKTQVVIGLNHAIRVSPRAGWIRGDSQDTAETLKKLANTLEANNELKAEIRNLKEAIGTKTSIGGDLASGQDTITLGFQSSRHRDWKIDISWDSIFKAFGPLLLSEISEWRLYHEISRIVAAKSKSAQTDPNGLKNAVAEAELIPDDFYKVVYQFMALNYIEPTTIVSQTHVFNKPETRRETGFRITKEGARILGSLQAIRKSSKDEQSNL